MDFDLVARFQFKRVDYSGGKTDRILRPASVFSTDIRPK